MISVLGYDKKNIKVSKFLIVYLKPITYDLEEIVIFKKKETKQIEIGKTKMLFFNLLIMDPKLKQNFSVSTSI